MNSGSYNAHTNFPVWVGGLGGSDVGLAACRTILAACGRLERAIAAVCHQFSADGFAGAQDMRAVSIAKGAVAPGRGFTGFTDAVARSIHERVLSTGVSEHVAGSGRSLRRLDALVLCRCHGRGAGGESEGVVRPRPRLLAGEDLPSEPRQKRSVAKRERLKKAGLELFGEKGYEKTSIEQIARRARLAVGGFYQHYRSKRQLLLSLMDELLEMLSQLNLQPQSSGNVKGALLEMLSRAFSHDLHYLGAYRGWQEAVLSDPELARKQEEIHAWTTARVLNLFQLLQQLPGARQGVNVTGLAAVMDGLFWSLLGQAARMPKGELNQWLDSATHLIYHAMFTDTEKRSRRG